jgi:hypothetical protein
VTEIGGSRPQPLTSSFVGASGAISGTVKGSFPPGWKIGAYVKRKSGDTPNTAWSLAGSTEPISGTWRIEDVPFRIPASGETAVDIQIVVVWHQGLEKSPANEQLIALSNNADVSPHLIQVRVPKPRVNIAGFRVNPFTVEGSADNILPQAEKVCVVVQVFRRGKPGPQRCLYGNFSDGSWSAIEKPDDSMEEGERYTGQVVIVPKDHQEKEIVPAQGCFKTDTKTLRRLR